MLGWSRKLVMCFDGEADIPQDLRDTLERLEIQIEEEKIIALEGEGDQIRGVRFESGRFLDCEALFFYSRQKQCSTLAHQLGLEVDDEGEQIQHCDTTSSVPGLYVAGNTCTGLQLVIMAAADGTQAAFNINQALLEEDVKRADAALERSEPIPEPNTITTPAAP
jgi:thioredoxin reductase